MFQPDQGKPFQCVIPYPLSMTEKPETAPVTTKEQIVKPATAISVGRGRGILKRAPGHASLIEECAEHKRQESALEERRAR